MASDGLSLTEFTKYLVNRGALDLDFARGRICGTCLNPRDNPSLSEEDIRYIVSFLYEELDKSGICYDVIASIPTGGNPYAEGIARMASERGNQVSVLQVRSEERR